MIDSYMDWIAPGARVLHVQKVHSQHKTIIWQYISESYNCRTYKYSIIYLSNNTQELDNKRYIIGSRTWSNRCMGYSAKNFCPWGSGYWNLPPNTEDSWAILAQEGPCVECVTWRCPEEIFWKITTEISQLWPQFVSGQESVLTMTEH